jgi:transmembrane sensor
VAADGQRIEPGKLEISKADAWRQRRLIFEGARLDEIVAEFNRYNRHKLRVEGDALAGRRFRGVFDADDPSSLVQYLSREPGITFERDGDTLVIRASR